MLGAIFPVIALCPSEQVPLIKQVQRTLSFSFLTGQKMTPKMTDKIYFEYANAMDVELITFG